MNIKSALIPALSFSAFSILACGSPTASVSWTVNGVTVEDGGCQEGDQVRISSQLRGTTRFDLVPTVANVSLGFAFSQQNCSEAGVSSIDVVVRRRLISNDFEEFLSETVNCDGGDEPTLLLPAKKSMSPLSARPKRSIYARVLKPNNFKNIRSHIGTFWSIYTAL